MKKVIGKKEKTLNKVTSMALWGSSVRSRSRPPLLSIPKNVDVFEIPGEWEVLPAARMTKNGPSVCRVLLRKTPKKFEPSLKARKGSKTSA